MPNHKERVFPFPAQKETKLIKEPNYKIYQSKLKSYLKKGYEIIIASCVYKKTRFGGTISYFAEVEK